MPRYMYSRTSVNCKSANRLLRTQCWPEREGKRSGSPCRSRVSHNFHNSTAGNISSSVLDHSMLSAPERMLSSGCVNYCPAFPALYGTWLQWAESRHQENHVTAMEWKYHKMPLMGGRYNATDIVIIHQTR